MRGFEPPTPRLGGVCSILLSYRDLYVKMSLSLTITHYEIEKMLCPQGFKPINARLGGGRSILLSYGDLTVLLLYHVFCDFASPFLKKQKKSGRAGC